MESNGIDTEARDDALWLKESELIALRDDLLRFTQLQLRDPSIAEDIVQETLSAAYAKRDSFSAKANIKTWIFSILRNKIVDQFRHLSRHKEDSLSLEKDLEGLFDTSGHWNRDKRPGEWGNPEKALVDEQFWQVFDLCLNNLPAATARVFSMRELMGLTTNEICIALEISETNCWVILHRARSKLRLCLESTWFKQG